SRCPIGIVEWRTIGALVKVAPCRLSYFISFASRRVIMIRRVSAVRASRLWVELLESRLTPSGDLTVALDPVIDQFGDQVLTLQAFDDPARTAFSIFDTGASAVTFSADDQEAFSFFGTPIPIKVPGGAAAEGIGGAITGDVSQPGTILADGLHAAQLQFDQFGFPFFDVTYGPDAGSTDNVQVFVGTLDGSPIMPTITGTPLLNPSPAHPDGLAAKIDMQGELLDFSDLI